MNKEAFRVIKGEIFDIQRYSVHDGAGIRTTVFFKGCPLRCMWCANPEAQSSARQLARFRSQCTLCLECVDSCPASALTFDGSAIHVNRQACTLCGQCVRTCRHDAIKIFGYTATVSNVMDVVERDRVYYDLSGGGMTLSGGEPTMQKAFCAGLLKAAKHKDIPTAVETCGCSIPQDFKEAVADADMLYFDFKLENSGLHKKYTGASNARIKENLRWLISSNVRFTLRMPVLPCINTSEERLAEYICFLKTTGFDTPIELMPYHRLGVYKYSALGRDYMLEDMKRPSLEELKAIRDLLEKHGFESRVVV